ncbi:MAG: M28 family peptidase [Ignavibacteriales bacterium]|nr:M28 family peptidase [Ignavibacteriales bacterium]
MKQSLLLLGTGAILVMLCACSRQDDLSLSRVTAARLKERTAVLAHDSMEGRAPGTRGEERALTYIIAQYKALGLEPAGENGTYLQRVPVIGVHIDPSATMEIGAGNKTARLKFPEEFVATTGVYEPAIAIKGADLVFVGYGIVAPEFGWDDYKGVDVTGKTLLIINDDPNTGDSTFFAGKGRTYYGRWTYKYEIAARKGAIGAIIIHTTSSAGYPFQVVKTSRSRENFDLDLPEKSRDIKLKGWTTEEATRRYLALTGFDLDTLVASAQKKTFKPIALGLKVSGRMNYAIRRLETRNVIGILRGGDQKLSQEYVVVSSHHDHLGIGAPVEGDSIYNGALDNASGVSMILAIAEEFAAMKEKPKRSMLFAAVAAEEKNLLGSQYFAEHPTVPAASMIANVNIDGINIWGRTSDVICLGAERSSLGADVEAIAAVMKLVVRPDAFPEQGSFYRSDHFSFAKVGIPSLSLRSCAEYAGKPAAYGKQVSDEFNLKHYHQPSDELRDDWNYDGALQQAEFALRLIRRLANAGALPVWNKGDEFEAAGLRMRSRK